MAAKGKAVVATPVAFYDFIDQRPALAPVVIIEGTGRALAEIALPLIIDVLLPPDMRDLNLDRFAAPGIEMGKIAEALRAMPFLAERRVVVVTEAQSLKSDPRRELAAVAKAAPDGNTLVICDLLSPKSKSPTPLGAQCGEHVLRIDVTATQSARTRFIHETLAERGAQAEPSVIAALTESDADLIAIRSDIERLALAGKTIRLADLEQESLHVENPKAYLYASALVAGDVRKAMSIAHELFAQEPNNAVVPLLSALASECNYVWEMSRRGGQLPPRIRFRESELRRVAVDIGERRARAGYDRAVNALAAVVSGEGGNSPEDYRTILERITVELSRLRRRK